MPVSKTSNQDKRKSTDFAIFIYTTLATWLSSEFRELLHIFDKIAEKLNSFIYKQLQIPPPHRGKIYPIFSLRAGILLEKNEI